MLEAEGQPSRPPAADEPGDEEAAFEPLVVAEQVHALFRNTLLPYAVSVVNASIMVLALGDAASLAVRGLWWVTITALAIGRFAFARAYARARPTPAQAPR